VLTGTGQLVIDFVGPGLQQNQEKFDITFDFVPQGSGGSEFILVIVLVVVGYIAWRKKWFQKFGLFKKKK
jgi:hypothetical protein